VTLVPFVRTETVIFVGVVTFVGFAVRLAVVQVRAVSQLLDHAGMVQSVAEMLPDGPGGVVIVVIALQV